MSNNAQRLCDIIRHRTEENRRAITRLSPHLQVLGPAWSVLRQELDSMVRVIFLLQVSSIEERERLIQSTLRGEKWKVPTARGRLRLVTDNEMVSISQHLVGWTLSVYKFGCAFIHLSDFHNHSCENPFEKLPTEEREDILSYMRYYHGGPRSDNPSVEELACFIPGIFEKIAANLECYLEELEQDKVIEVE